MAMHALGIILPVMFLTMFAIEAFGGHHTLSKKTFKELGFAAVTILTSGTIAAPLIGVLIGFAFNAISPATRGALSGYGFWTIFPLWFFADEFAHYWVHRLAHEWPWLWKFHRTHHSAEEMNVTVVYRINVFWNFMLPQTWFAAAAIHLGIPMVFVASTLITFGINVFTHTSYRWDLALRRLPGMEPVMNVLEKIITLPDTHHAHHGLGREAFMKGNYAVTFFFFDVLLGTARFPRRRQSRFGLPQRFDWREELFWPVYKRRRAKDPVAAPIAE